MFRHFAKLIVAAGFVADVDLEEGLKYTYTSWWLSETHFYDHIPTFESDLTCLAFCSRSSSGIVHIVWPLRRKLLKFEIISLNFLQISTPSNSICGKKWISLLFSESALGYKEKIKMFKRARKVENCKSCKLNVNNLFTSQQYLHNFITKTCKYSFHLKKHLNLVCPISSTWWQANTDITLYGILNV